MKVPLVASNEFGQQAAPSGFSAESRRRLGEADRQWPLKTALRTAAIICALIGFSLYAAAIPIWDNEFYWTEGPNRGDWEDGFPLGVLVFAFIWNVAALVTLLVLRTAMKPYIPMLLDFLTWLVLIPAIVKAGELGMFLDFSIPRYEYVQPGIYDVVHHVGAIELAALIFAIFTWILQVTLFVLACRDTHKWRKSNSLPPQSVRALDHGEFARDNDAHMSFPPKYEEDTQAIEMSPTSAKSREFV